MIYFVILTMEKSVDGVINRGSARGLVAGQRTRKEVFDAMLLKLKKQYPEAASGLCTFFYMEPDFLREPDPFDQT
jgi:hypothetical protein